MADIRIKDLATTASSTASDDFLAVDGSANGTRKLNAYSPTFGGNLTVSGAGNSSVAGTWLIGTTTDSGNGKLQLATHTTSAGGIGFGTDTQIWRSAAGALQASASVAWPTLKISDDGTGTYQGGVLAFGDGNSSARNVGIWRGASNSLSVAGNVLNLGGYAGITFTTGAAQIGSQTTALTLDSSQNATFAGKLTSTDAGYTNSGYEITNTTASRTTGWFLTNSGATTLRDVTGAADLLSVDTSGNATFVGKATASGQIRGANVVASNLGTADNGFYGTAGTDAGSGHRLALVRTDTPTGGSALLSAFGAAVVEVNATTGLNTGTRALTIDTSANATFAGTIKPQQAATASAPTYVKGAIYFDTTLNKLRVGGATGWETITSV